MNTTNKLKIYDFMKIRHITMAISLSLILGSIISLFVKGLHFGLDFTGGTLIELKYAKPVELASIRSQLSSAGYSAVVQYFGTATDVLIRIPPDSDKDQKAIGQKIVAMLQEGQTEAITLQRIEFVGPQVGEELREDGVLAIFVALLMILVYVAFRFQYKFSIGAIAALFHDVIITIGFFSFFQWEFDLTVLAAVLAIIGYSINDTIVVFDRVRENFRKLRKETVLEIINISMSQVLARSIATSFTTFLVVIALFLFGGDLIHNFALAMIIGIVVGAYSSIYIATSLCVTMRIKKQDLMLPEKEGADADRSGMSLGE